MEERRKVRTTSPLKVEKSETTYACPGSPNSRTSGFEEVSTVSDQQAYIPTYRATDAGVVAFAALPTPWTARSGFEGNNAVQQTEPTPHQLMQMIANQYKTLELHLKRKNS